MPILVQKFGGTSVATTEKIKAAASRAMAEVANGYQVVVVVSARGKKTDELVALANELTEAPALREMDVLLSTGEQETIALASMAVHAMGGKAISMTGFQMGVLTDNSHQRARIRQIDVKRIKNYLDEGNIVFAAGFQGIDDAGDITTLGRGGSDTTAAALAAVLKAERCDIFTDVNGVYTTDPRMVSEARKVEHISYDEMLELASSGAGVMHSRSIEFAKKYRVPLRVRPSFEDGEGTLIAQAPDNDPTVVTGIALVKNEVRVNCREIPDRPGVSSTIFSKLSQRKIPTDLVVQDVSQDGLAEVSFTIPQDDLAETLTALESAVKELGAGQITHSTNVSKLSVVGDGMQTHSGVAAQMFQTLAEANINLSMISTSEIKISVLIDRDDAGNAVQAVHKSFNLQDSKRPEPTFGAKLLEDEEVQDASRQQKELEVVKRLAGMEDIVVSEIEVDTDQARITLQQFPDRIGLCADIFIAVARAEVMVDMIVQNVSEEGMINLSFTVPSQDVLKCVNILKEKMQSKEMNETGLGRVTYDEHITKISVVGIGVRTHTGVGEKLFQALAAENINIDMISTSEMRVSVVVAADAAERAETALRKMFGI